MVGLTVLVLALGNTLLTDDGAGQAVLERLGAEAARWRDRVELLDGGTQGIMLLGRLEGRRAVLFLDAVRRGAAPGTVHVLTGEEILAAANPSGHSAHEANAGDLLRAAALLGKVPPRMALVGIEPEQVRTGFGLSGPVRAAVDEAARRSAGLVDRLLDE